MIDREAAQVAGPRSIVDLLPLGDIGAKATIVFRYLFAELDRYHDVTALIEKEGGVAPSLGRQFWAEIGEPGYQLGAEVLGRQLNAEGPGGWDAEALSAVLLGAVVNMRRSQWTFGHTPLDVDEERMVQVIVHLLVTAARAG